MTAKIPVTVRLAPDEIQAIDDVAGGNRTGPTRSAWIRQAILSKLREAGWTPIEERAPT